jgi:anthranilate synthase/phosphoribosyltransferase
VVEIDENGIRKEYVVFPESFGVTQFSADDLAGGDAAQNAGLAMELVNGIGRPAILAAVALNAGAALYIARQVKTIQEGYQRALQALEDGSVLRKIEEVRAASCA